MKAGRDLIRSRTLLPSKVNFPSYMVLPNLELENENQPELRPAMLSSEVWQETNQMNKPEDINRLLTIESQLNIQERIS